MLLWTVRPGEGIGRFANPVPLNVTVKPVVIDPVTTTDPKAETAAKALIAVCKFTAVSVALKAELTFPSQSVIVQVPEFGVPLNEMLSTWFVGTEKLLLNLIRIAEDVPLFET
jgi:hypothetical protein